MSASIAVLTYRAAKAQGFDARLYAYRSGEVPIGKLLVILDRKIWGRGVMGIGCYFTAESVGKRFMLTAYWEPRANGYVVWSSGMNLLSCPIGRIYTVETGENSRGNPTLLTMAGPLAPVDEKQGELP